MLDYESVVFLTRQEIASTGLGTTPKAINAYESLQEVAFNLNPAAVDEANANAAAADQKAETAGTAAAGAQDTADSAKSDAALAQARADEAFEEAEKKVDRNDTEEWPEPPTSPDLRIMQTYTAPVISATYTPTEVQALADQVQRLTRVVITLLNDLRDNEVLKSAP